MAVFPDLEPNIRTYNFGLFPLTEVSSQTAGTVRFSHGVTPENYRLILGYTALTDADATLLREHFQEQGGTYRSFELPSIVWKGHTFSSVIAPYTMLWRYSSIPEEEHLDIGRISITVDLVSDINVPADIEIEVPVTLTAGGAGGGAAGATVVSAASIAAGTATGA